jgi:hypothetical protein
MPGDEPLEPDILTRVDVPAFVQQPPDRIPVRSFDEQVVAFGDDEGNFPRDGDGPCDGFLQAAVEQRGVDDPFVAGANPPQKADVPGGIEGVRGALALMPTQPVQLCIGEVEPVQADEHRITAEAGDQEFSECGFARSWRAGDAENPTLTGDDQGTGSLDQVVEED